MIRALAAVRRPRFGAPWRERGLRRLWVGETVSAVGSEIGGIAMILSPLAIVAAPPLRHLTALPDPPAPVPA